MGPIVIDANILFGALIRDGTHRRIILHGTLDLHSPDAVWTELERNQDVIRKKARVSSEVLGILVASLRTRIKTIPREALGPYKDQALARAGEADRLDAPYVAAAMAVQGGIWSHDKRLAQTAGVPVWTTAGIIAAMQE